MYNAFARKIASLARKVVIVSESSRLRLTVCDLSDRDILILFKFMIYLARSRCRMKFTFELTAVYRIQFAARHAAAVARSSSRQSSDTFFVS